MKDKEQPKKKERGKRYLTKFELVETNAELPIQGQVRDPEDLVDFLNDLENDAVAKVICVYLDGNHLFLGHQVFLGATPSTFDTQLLYHYYSLFLAKKFIVMVNHPGSLDATPTESDLVLMRKLQADAQVLSFKPFFADFVVVAKRSYFSMGINDGSGCHCGHQKYDPDLFA